jgi:predicted Zn-dependent peptidase
VGIWVRIGSRDESDERAGISHFLEHMVFKGTEHRTPFQISEEIDSLGGYINAMTSKEYTAYYVDVLPQHLERSLDVLTDMMNNPLFQDEDIAKEKGVVLEEIRMQEDSPQDKVFDIFSESLWDTKHPLSRPIIGSSQTVNSFERADLIDHFSLYDGERVTIAVAGDVDPEILMRIANEKMGNIAVKTDPLPQRTSPAPSWSSHVEDRDLQQAHICLGTHGIARNDERRFPLELMSTILGGGMSSRLFKRIREELGLAYAVSGQSSYYSDSGFFVIYLGTEPKNASQALEVCMEEIKRMQNEPVPEETLWLAKEKIKGNMLLGLESSHSRMIRLAISDIYGTHWTIDEIIERVEKVTIDEVQSVAKDIFDKDSFTLSIVGPGSELASVPSSIGFK